MHTRCCMLFHMRLPCKRAVCLGVVSSLAEEFEEGEFCLQACCWRCAFEAAACCCCAWQRPWPRRCCGALGACARATCVACPFGIGPCRLGRRLPVCVHDCLTCAAIPHILMLHRCGAGGGGAD